LLMLLLLVIPIRPITSRAIKNVEVVVVKIVFIKNGWLS
jgi:hypothetical protein